MAESQCYIPEFVHRGGAAGRRDLVEVVEIRLTQECLAQMLGTQRSRVSEAAIILQFAGLIRYSRGIINILDRAGLEGFVCECYRVVKVESDRLLSG